jgi:hypothetical protein
MEHNEQKEIQDFLFWCTEHLNVQVGDADESTHMHFGDHFVGGWAGDTRQFFLSDDEVIPKMLAMYNTWRNYQPA